MVCTFFGHKDTSSHITNELEMTVRELIKSGVREFFVGNNGNFDFYVQKILSKLAEEEDISFAVVLSYIDECAIGTSQEYTLFPEGQEDALPRFAIVKRNQWIINKADVAVVYVKNHFSNANKWAELAKKKKNQSDKHSKSVIMQRLI